MEDEWYLTGIIRSILYATGLGISGPLIFLHSKVWIMPAAICVGGVLIYTVTMLRELRRS